MLYRISIILFTLVLQLAQADHFQLGTGANQEPVVPMPPSRITDLQLVKLGLLLFMDKRLSADNTLSCNSCHPLNKGGMDNKRISTGINGRLETRNTPTIFNADLQFKQFWDGRVRTLEEHVDRSITAKVEMSSNWKNIINKIKKDPTYRRMFTQNFPQTGITIDNICLAISTFERSLHTPGSAFDRYLQGNKQAISDTARQGYQLFKDYGCASCHQGVLLGGNLFSRMGQVFPYYDMQQQYMHNKPDYGRYEITGREKDKFIFKVPGLRNITQTAPYFHDGSIHSLHQAVIIMVKYQLGKKVNVNDVDKMVAFLKTLDAPLEPEIAVMIKQVSFHE